MWIRRIEIKKQSSSLHKNHKIYDCIGVGFGPSNIALAIALEEIGISDHALFLEKAVAPDWQGEMAIDGSDIQHNPLRDFVTPRNPTSRYGFLSYLKAKNRLFAYLNLSAPFPPRCEYSRYIVWVARHFDRIVKYAQPVSGIYYDWIDGQSLIRVESNGHSYLARTVSVAPGRSNLIPECFKEHIGPRMVHASSYRSSVARWQYEGNVKNVAVFGASQSAVEIMLDLPKSIPNVRITAIGRSFGIKQKDLSPFTEAIYEPEFVDIYHSASEEVQATLRQELWRSNYSAADHDVVSRLHFCLYEQMVTGRSQLSLMSNKSVEKSKNVGALPDGSSL